MTPEAFGELRRGQCVRWTVPTDLDLIGLVVRTTLIDGTDTTRSASVLWEHGDRETYDVRDAFKLEVVT